jgi:hypothetical protein
VRVDEESRLLQGISFPCLSDFIDQRGYFGILAKLAHFLVMSRRFQFEFLANHVQYLHVLGDFLLREHTELQVQVRPLLSAAHLVFLVDENACGQENEFDSHNQGQERKRIWIEWLQPSDPLGVQDNPGDNEEDLSNNEAKASEEVGNATTPSLSPGLLSDQLLLKQRYCLDVPLGCRGDRGVR